MKPAVDEKANDKSKQAGASGTLLGPDGHHFCRLNKQIHLISIKFCNASNLEHTVYL